MRVKIESKYYVLLWCLVTFLFILNFLVFFVYHVGFGRWECVDNENVCKTYIEYRGVKYCVEEEDYCVKSVWTYNEKKVVEEPKIIKIDDKGSDKVSYTPKFTYRYVDGE